MVQCRECQFGCAQLQKSLVDEYVLTVEFLRIWLVVQFVPAKSPQPIENAPSYVYTGKALVAAEKCAAGCLCASQWGSVVYNDGEHRQTK
jgi:hypothetical protein